MIATLTPEQKAEAIRLHRGGQSHGEIAKRFGVTRNVILGVCQRARRADAVNDGWQPGDERVLAKLLKWGWKYKDIAQALGISMFDVAKKRRQFGL